MIIKFRCPKCKHIYKADNSSAGKASKCRRCNTTFAIPSSSEWAKPNNSVYDMDIVMLLFCAKLMVYLSLLITPVFMVISSNGFVHGLAFSWIISSGVFSIWYIREPCPDCGKRWSKHTTAGFWERGEHGNQYERPHCFCNCGHQFY